MAAMEEDDWIFLGDGGAGAGSDSDSSASEDGSDSDTGFTIVRRGGRKGGGDAAVCSVVVSDDAPAPAPPPVPAVAQLTPPGLSFKLVSYAEAFSATGGGREQPGCNDEATAAGEAIIIKHDGTGSSAETPSAPSVAVTAAPTVNCPETAATVLHGEAPHSELASGMDMDVDQQGGAEEMEEEDGEPEPSCEEDDDDDDDMDNSSEDEEDTDSEDDDEDKFCSSDEEDEEDAFSSSEEEDEDTFSSSDEEYTESFSEEEEYTAEIYSDEEEDDDGAESSGEEEGSESCGEVGYVESSGEESHDADNTGDEEDDDVESTGEEDAESTGEESNDDDDSEISGEAESHAECSGDEDDVESSGGDESCGVDSDVDAERCGEEEKAEDAERCGEEEKAEDAESCGEEEKEDDAKRCGEEEQQQEEDTVSADEKEEESSNAVDGAENGKKDIFAMLLPRPTTACDANAEQSHQDIADVAENGNQDIFAMLFPKAKAVCGATMNDYGDESKHGCIIDDTIDTDSSGMDDNCLESDKEGVIVNVAESGNQDIFDMPPACDANIDGNEDDSEHANMDDHQEELADGSLFDFDMLLPRDHAIGDDIAGVAEKCNQDIFDKLFPRATACHANVDDYEDESELGDIDYEAKEEHDDNIDTDSSHTEEDGRLEPDEEADDIAGVAENGIQYFFAMLAKAASGANMDGYGDESCYIIDCDEDGSLFAMLLPRDHAIDDDIDSDSSGMESDEEDVIVNVAENGNLDIFDMPRAPACDANMDDSEHANMDGHVEELADGSLFDMLLPRDHAIGDDIDTDSSGMEDNCLKSDEEDGIVNVAENGNQYIFDMMLLPMALALACDANIHDNEDESKHVSIDFDEEEEVDDGSRDCAIDDDIDSSDGEDEAATATEFGGRAARSYDDIDTDSDMEEGDDDEDVAADVDGTTGGGVEIQCCGFSSQSQTQRQALCEDLLLVQEGLRRRQLAAEALESSSGQQLPQRSYDDVDDTCDVPGIAAPSGGDPAGSCACARTTAEAQFTARAERDTERALAMEEARRREAAQRELDRALATEAAAAAEALESALQLQRCATAERERQATGVTQLDVAKRADLSFIIGVYVLVFLVVSLLNLALPSTN